MRKQNNEEAYLQNVGTAISDENGHQVANLLSRESTDIKTMSLRNIEDAMKKIPFYNNMQGPWADVVKGYLQMSLSYKNTEDITNSVELQITLTQLIIRTCQSWPIWTMPILYTVCRDLHVLARRADMALRKNGDNPKYLEESARIINRAFTICITDRSPLESSRKWGTYYMVGLIFRIYFELNKLALSKNVLRAVRASADMPPIDDYPRAEIITFRYYVGIIAFLDEDYKQAETELNAAFEMCHQKAVKNQEMILVYLVPTILLSNRIPKREIVTRYSQLNELYGSMISCLEKGDLRGYDKAVNEREIFLVKRKTFLAFERARNVVIRNLFKKVYLWLDRSTRISVRTFQVALKFTGHDVDGEEVECLLANMIYKGYLKGYISRERATVVLSKDNPFPTVI